MAAEESESTPLLSPPLAAASAPPVPDEEEIPLVDNSSSSHHILDDDTSHSQLSLSHSQKSAGRRSKKKRPGRGDASSTAANSRKSEKSSKSKKKKRQDDGRPQKTMCHLSFDTVRYMAIIASFAMLCMQFVPIVMLLDKNEITGLQYFVRLYLIIFCVSFILLESRIPLLRRIAFPAHDNWILRGFMYTFIGVIGMEQDVAIKVEDIAAAGTSHILGPDYGTLLASLSIAITTWIMVGVGMLYMLLGMMCLQKWYDRIEEEHRAKVNEWKRKKKREIEFQKDSAEYIKYEKDRREGRGEWYDDIEQGE